MSLLLDDQVLRNSTTEDLPVPFEFQLDPDAVFMAAFTPADPSDQTMPLVNRALLFRDPGGNLVNLFTLATPAARAKFGV